MRKLHLTFIAFLMLISAHAQYGITKKRKPEAELIKTLPLLVVLHDYDDPLYQRMKADLKEAMQKYWHYSDEIIFVSKDELREYDKDETKRDKYAYLMFSERLYQANVPAGCFCIGLLNKKTFTHFKKFGNYGEKLTMADYKQGLYWLQKDLETVFSFSKIKENGQNAIEIFKENIKVNTLLLDKDLVTDELIENIGENYNYNYSIVSKEEIDQAIMEGRRNVMYLKPFYLINRPIVKTSRSTDFTQSNPTGLGQPLIKINETQTTKVSSFTLNNVYRAEDNNLLAMFKANAKDKTTLKQFKKVMKVLK
ncbi:hypothetical protein LG651_12565 [Tamlana sp. 62-3]|uniref:Uncharacterized protein n=1 Tax=Neotamlana sargassicola TaxID=2883125 RepID=A0A9X1I840_9FLAO|nr:hypothetical protein [Tamlana sargassicola]MCB4809083.1 hypothetical protein [Tamlana sargassicola]